MYRRCLVEKTRGSKRTAYSQGGADRSQRGRSQTGGTIMVLTVIMTVLVIASLGMFGFEVARGFLAKEELRVATDSAALAYMTTFTGTNPHNQALADTHGREMFGKNAVLGSSLRPAEIDFTAPTNDFKAVHAKGRTLIKTVFGQAIGINDYVITQESTVRKPKLDLVVAWDVSKSMINATPTLIVRREWSATGPANANFSFGRIRYTKISPPGTTAGNQSCGSPFPSQDLRSASDAPNLKTVVDGSFQPDLRSRADSDFGHLPGNNNYRHFTVVVKQSRDIILNNLSSVNENLRTDLRSRIRSIWGANTTVDTPVGRLSTAQMTEFIALVHRARQNATMNSALRNGTTSPIVPKFTTRPLDFTDLVVDLSDEKVTEVFGQNFANDEAKYAAIVEASRGNLETEELYYNSGARLTLEGLGFVWSPGMNYQARYLKAAFESMEPYNTCRDSLIDFIKLMEKNTDLQVSLVPFAGRSTAYENLDGGGRDDDSFPEDRSNAKIGGFRWNPISANYDKYISRVAPAGIIEGAKFPGAARTDKKDQRFIYREIHYNGNIAEFERELRRLWTHWGTDTGGSLRESLRLLQDKTPAFKTRSDARKAVVLFTDGLPAWFPIKAPYPGDNYPLSISQAKIDNWNAQGADDPQDDPKANVHQRAARANARHYAEALGKLGAPIFSIGFIHTDDGAVGGLAEDAEKLLSDSKEDKGLSWLAGNGGKNYLLYYQEDRLRPGQENDARVKLNTVFTNIARRLVTL